MGFAADVHQTGDVSMTRQDAAIGDNRNFQVDLYDEVFDYRLPVELILTSHSSYS
jgi:hypothetical protein